MFATFFCRYPHFFPIVFPVISSSLFVELVLRLQTPTVAIERIENVTFLVVADRTVMTLVTLHVFIVSPDVDNSARGITSNLHFIKIH